MKNLFRFIVLVLLVAGWGLSAAAIYVVRTPAGIAVIPKDRITLGGIAHCYIDTRNWTTDDVANHPAVTERLIATGKADMLQSLFPNATGDALEAELRAAILRGPQSTPVHTIPPTGRRIPTGNTSRQLHRRRRWSCGAPPHRSALHRRRRC